MLDVFQAMKNLRYCPVKRLNLVPWTGCLRLLTCRAV